MHDNLEESEFVMDASFLPTIEACMTLDTIQEAREGSSLSGESNENLEELRTLDSPSEETGTTEDSGTNGKKIKVQIMNDEDSEDDEENEEEDIMAAKNLRQAGHSDIDGGWAWVVLIAFFLIFCISSGLLGSTGLYYGQMLREFKQSRSYTAWMGSLINAFYMLVGPLCSVVLKKTGCRVTIMIGGVIISTGYLLSAFANSLPIMFFTYGVVVASGMNFVYSGQIIALTQYFHTRHSLATSLSMIGIGIGLFTMIRILEMVILEYGWRISFIFCAALSLHICALGALVFPVRTNGGDFGDGFPLEDDFQNHPEDSFTPSNSRKLHLHRTGHSGILNRSVSSLRLSLGAGYLSSSFSSINNELKSGNSAFGSNPNSFCSRGSQNFGGMRASQQSFLHLANGDMPGGLLPFLRSNQHSFCSKGSFYALHSLKSNPQSFCNKNSQVDLHYLAYHHHLPPLMDVSEAKKAKEKMFLSEIGSRQSGISGLSHIKEIENSGSKCNLLFKKIQNAFTGMIGENHLKLLFDPCLWLLNFAMLFACLASVKLYVIYQDLGEYLGVGDYYFYAVSIIGIGDIIGRLSAGILTSWKNTNTMLFYSVVLALFGISLGFLLLATWGPLYLIVSFLFGFFSGQQNVLITLAPAILFGREMLVTVFGYALFFAGLGALVGAPIAGFIVDLTGSYNGVILLTVSCSFLSSSFLFLCNIINRRRKEKKNAIPSPCV